MGVLGLMLAPRGMAQAGRDYNGAILQAIGEMPKGGGYSVENKAKRSLEALQAAIRMPGGQMTVLAGTAQPSFCSSATYVVLLKALDRIYGAGKGPMKGRVAQRLLVQAEQADGEGVWGRWNANGPGVAKFFHDTRMGRSFEGFAQARPGDFLKIFWSEEIGQKEFGHLVVYLGIRRDGGQELVRFWSSNLPGGYGEKEVPREKIKWALFSRLEHPERITAVTRLTKTDRFLAEMLTKRFTRDEVRKAVGMK